jgi:hypothetical protein
MKGWLRSISQLHGVKYYDKLSSTRQTVLKLFDLNCPWCFNFKFQSANQRQLNVQPMQVSREKPSTIGASSLIPR